MNRPAAPTPLHTLSLDALCEELVSGRAVCIEGQSDAFSLATAGARSIFDWYRGSREKWAKNVFASDIEAIVDRVRIEPPAIPPSPMTGAGGRTRKLFLKSVRAHRFAGIHHYGDPQNPPPEFSFEVRCPLTLVEGKNGAGKTSLLNAIMWCLTGHLCRSHRPPEPAATNVPVTVAMVDGASPEGGAPSGQVMSSITPLPTATVLDALGDRRLPVDTWVELAFDDETAQPAGSVRRSIDRTARGSIVETPPDFAALGLDSLSREVGTRMPGLIPHINFGGSSDLGRGVGELIGIRPLQDLASHAGKVRGKLSGDLLRDRRREIAACDAEFSTARTELEGLIATRPALDPGCSLPAAPGTGVKDELADLAGHYERLREQTFKGAEAILGDAFDATSRTMHADLEGSVGPAIGLLESSNLGRLPSALRLAALGKMQEDQLASASALIAPICAEAEALADQESKHDVAVRHRLYARVAAWMKGLLREPRRIRDCPICRSPLEGKRDEVTGRPVEDHLREFLDGEREFLGKTAQVWERDALNSLAGGLPQALQSELGCDLPEHPGAMIEAMFVRELFDSDCLKGSLSPLKDRAAALCAEATAALPPCVAPPTPEVPACFGGASGKLGVAVRRLHRAIAFSRWRRENGEACKAAFEAIVGQHGAARGVAESDAESDAGARSLSASLRVLDGLVKNAAPIGRALALIAAMAKVVDRRDGLEDRVADYGLAADSLGELVGLSALVDNQIAFLTRTLGESAARWKHSLYSPAFKNAPSTAAPEVTADGTIAADVIAGGACAPAQHLANTAELRASLLSFLLAFWEHLLETRGGLALFLLDDPQGLFDLDNRRRVANSLPAIARNGAVVIATTLDPTFGRQVAAAAAREPSARNGIPHLLDHRQIHAPRPSRPWIALGPFAEAVATKRKAFEGAEQEVQPARDYANELRIYLEVRLVDLFDTHEPGLTSQPTLSSLIDALRRRIQAGNEPFASRAFADLVNDPAFVQGSRFLGLLNESHHSGSEQITYLDVWNIKDDCRRILDLVAVAHEESERWLRRDPCEPPAERPATPEILAFPRFDAPLYENLAAFSGGDVEGEAMATDERISAEWLAHHAVYVINGHNFGLPGPRHCRAIVDLSDAPVEDGRLVVALHGEKVYARRLSRDSAKPGQVMLASDAVDPSKRPPSLLLPVAEVRLLEVAGILFDGRPHYPKCQEEAALARDVGHLARVEIAFKVRGDSALPLAATGQTILGGEAIRPDQLKGLEGALVAISTTAGSMFKRVGKPMPWAARVRQFEAIGGLGDTLCVRVEEDEGDIFSGAPLLLSARSILGVIYRS